MWKQALSTSKIYKYSQRNATFFGGFLFFVKCWIRCQHWGIQQTSALNPASQAHCVHRLIWMVWSLATRDVSNAARVPSLLHEALYSSRHAIFSISSVARSHAANIYWNNIFMPFTNPSVQRGSVHLKIVFDIWLPLCVSRVGVDGTRNKILEHLV